MTKPRKPPASPSPAATRATPSLVAKKQPTQQRSAETYERILDVTATLLADSGIERLSTNLVCERAGLTPPALYRYFPNKYALLSELGQRLMQRQNDRVGQWITPDCVRQGVPGLEHAIAGLIADTHAVTAQTPGGVWIMRALRAVPVLQQVRLESHAAVTDAQASLLIGVLPGADPAELRLVSRIVVELIYATVEMMIDEPQLDVPAVARTVAGMMASQLDRLGPR